MYCPRCGKDGSLEQKFCRACGFQLDQVVELLEPQSVQVVDQNLAQFKLRRIGSIVVMSTISLALFGVCGAIIWAMVVGGIPVSFGLIGLLLLLGITFGFIFLGLAQLKAETSTASQTALDSNETSTRLLNQQALNIPPSVTERTTNLLSGEQNK
jgi:hypothetical protein